MSFNSVKKVPFKFYYFWLLLIVIFTGFFVVPFEGPDEVHQLQKLADSSLLIGNHIQERVLSGIGLSNNTFSFAQNQCRYINSYLSTDYRILKLSFSTISILSVFFLSKRYGSIAFSYFLWPSVFYYSTQINPDIIQIILSSLVLFLPGKILLPSLLANALIFDRSAVCGFFFLVIFNFIKKIPKRGIWLVLLLALGLTLLLDSQRATLSEGLANMFSSFNITVNNVSVESVISSNQSYGISPIRQLAALASSLIFLGGAASFYPTILYYVFFIGFILICAKRFKKASFEEYRTHKKTLLLALAAMSVAFFILRLILPPIGNGRYWLIIVPFILQAIGIQHQSNRNLIFYSLIIFTIISQSWMFLIWKTSC